MSRIGNLPINIPAGVEVSSTGNSVKVKGPKGELHQDLHESVTLEISESEVVVKPIDSSRQTKALQGTIRSLVANMVTGRLPC